MLGWQRYCVLRTSGVSVGEKEGVERRKRRRRSKREVLSCGMPSRHDAKSEEVPVGMGGSWFWSPMRSSSCGRARRTGRSA